jgi:hypothetical protein
MVTRPKPEDHEDHQGVQSVDPPGQLAIKRLLRPGPPQFGSAGVLQLPIALAERHREDPRHRVASLTV